MFSDKMGKKILLISANREQYPCPVVPVGLFKVEQELRQSGESTAFVDLCFAQEIDKLLSEKLTSFQPDIIIIAVRNIDNETLLTCKFYLEEIRSLIEYCKLQCSAQIIIGGIGFSINSKEIFEFLDADFGIMEQNSKSLMALIQHIKGGKISTDKLKTISGILFWENGVAQINKKREKYQPVSHSNWEYSLQHCDPNYYTFHPGTGHPPVFGIQTKTGCAFHCIHCPIPEIQGRNIQQIAIDEVIKTLKLMSEEYNIQRIFFTDNVFNYQYDQAIRLCRDICDQGIKIKWTCYLHPKMVDRDLVKAMVKAGCESVFFGVDTGSERLLKLWQKGFTARELILAGRVCHAEQLRSFYSLILGGWKETLETVAESLDTLKEAEAQFIWGAYGVRIYPNTELAKILFQRGILGNGASLLYPRFYLSPEVANIMFKKTITNFQKSHPHIILKVNMGERGTCKNE